MNQDPGERAIPFITYSERQGFVLGKEAEEILSRVEDKVAVVSIVGKYRTGKSFFVNRVLLNRQKGSGFAVGPTINPCTKGLWLWSKPLKSENAESEDTTVFLVDTEGFGGIDENVNHDSRIFLFALLLSSFFIYNSVGNIDENALNNISLVVNLAKEIQLKSNSSGNGSMQQVDADEELAAHFPSFLWVVRDFALKMVDQSGNPISAKEYLENSLTPQKGVSDQTESKNRIRRMIKHFFRDRDCATMVRPIESEKDLQKLDELGEECFRPEFVEQARNVRKKVFKRIRPKIFSGRSLNGPMLLELCRAYLSAINSGGVPNIENAWFYVCKNESKKALEETLTMTEGKLNELTNVSAESFKAVKAKMREEAYAIFRKKALGCEEELKELAEMLSVELTKRFRTYKTKVIERDRDSLEGVLKTKLEPLMERLSNDGFNNIYEFKDDLTRVKNDFENNVNGSKSQKTLIWLEYSEQVTLMAAEILLRRMETEAGKDSKRLTQKLELAESELASRRREFEVERESLLTRLQECERERATLRANETSMVEKLGAVRVEKEKFEALYKEVTSSAKNREELLEKHMKERIASLESMLEASRGEQATRSGDYDRERQHLSSELTSARRDYEALASKLQAIESDNKRLRLEHLHHQSNIEQLKQRIAEAEAIKDKEIATVRSECEKRLVEASEDGEKKKELARQQGEWLKEKTYLENQVTFLRGQLEENKRLHEALLIALQQGRNGEDFEKRFELLETNKNLSGALEKSESRCKILEEKSSKLKDFKRMVRNAYCMQCISCTRLVMTTVFLQHLQECTGNGGAMHTASSGGDMMMVMAGGLSPKALLPNPVGLGQMISQFNTTTAIPVPPRDHQSTVNNQSESGLHISINQTMVKEKEESKPYTEYLIQVVYKGSTKWTVARKYKLFCELYQSLLSTFPGIQLPHSAMSVFGAATSIKNVLNSKKTTLIEERRKALQQFLRDLAKFDVVRNSRLFRNFLDIDKNTGERFEEDQQQMTLNSGRVFNTTNGFSNSTNGLSDHKIERKAIFPESPGSFLRKWQEGRAPNTLGSLQENKPRANAYPIDREAEIKSNNSKNSLPRNEASDDFDRDEETFSHAESKANRSGGFSDVERTILTDLMPNPRAKTFAGGLQFESQSKPKKGFNYSLNESPSMGYAQKTSGKSREASSDYRGPSVIKENVKS